MKVELELTAEQLNEIKTKYSLTEKTSKGRLKPEVGAIYWYIGASGVICNNVWDNGVVENDRYAMGNVYLTEKEAEFAKQKRLVTQELKDFALEHNDGKIDWENSNNKYYICLSYFSRSYYSQAFELNIGVTRFYKDGDTIYFTSEEIAQQAIDAIGKERLMKYYFGEWEKQ